GDLVMIASRNLGEPLQETCARVKSGVCLCGRASQSRRIQFSAEVDARHEVHYDGMTPHGHYNIPIFLIGKLKGVLALYLCEGHIRDEREIEFLRIVANTLAGLIERAHAQEEIRRANAELVLTYETTLEGWSNALELRDKETEGHTQRVSEMTLQLARSMGLPEEDLVHIWRGSLLHDIGKMGIPDNILRKAGPLTDAERDVVSCHPQIAFDLLASIPFLRLALDIPYAHHEKWDGSGYPRGLKGEEIPLAARIFAVVDVWDALTSNRTYREAWPRDTTLEYIRNHSGSHFDPHVVEAFFAMMGGE
ncbi:MAG: HD domain-containing protein, partial [Anaerolineales bacterium]|nr:HD domain-containing protein [Anaerolineales bacterium]